MKADASLDPPIIDPVPEEHPIIQANLENNQEQSENKEKNDQIVEILSSNIEENKQIVDAQEVPISSDSNKPLVQSNPDAVAQNPPITKEEGIL